MTNNNKPSQPSAPNLSRRRFVQGSSALVMSAPLLAIPAWAQGVGSASSPSRQAPRRLANNPLGFNGARQDPATGLYHLGQGYRVYNPALMRFQACDSMSPFGKGGINAYAYCLGDPVNLRDPSGHFAIASILIGAAVGAAVGAATAAIGEGIRAGVTQTEFEWKQVVFGALLGGISGAFGGAAAGAKTGVKAGLAVGDALVSGAADFGLSVATGSDTKQAAISAGIGAAVGLVSFGAGIGVGKIGKSLSALSERVARIQHYGLDGGAGRGFPRTDPSRALWNSADSLDIMRNDLINLAPRTNNFNRDNHLRRLIQVNTNLITRTNNAIAMQDGGSHLREILTGRHLSLSPNILSFTSAYERFFYNSANIRSIYYLNLKYNAGIAANNIRDDVYTLNVLAGLPARCYPNSYLLNGMVYSDGIAFYMPEGMWD